MCGSENHLCVESALGVRAASPTSPASFNNKRGMKSSLLPSRPREDNPVVFLEISDISNTSERVLGRLYFELRQDIVPMACDNFLQLVIGGHVTAADTNKVVTILMVLMVVMMVLMR